MEKHDHPPWVWSLGWGYNLFGTHKEVPPKITKRLKTPLGRPVLTLDYKKGSKVRLLTRTITR